MNKIIDILNTQIKEYENIIDKLRELRCPEPVLMQVVSIYNQKFEDLYLIKRHNKNIRKIS